ncbi:MAG: ribonuclease D [Pseudomonadota bacterium]|nr:ribonuclease D [Pseudomonadota bacterium]
MTANKWIWVDAAAKRDDAAREISRAPVIGLDTEYDSFRYFRERLCLLQVNSGEKSYVFDPLDSLDFSFLGDVFYHPDKVKVIHAGDNDIRILKRDYGFSFRNVFDTHRAAALLGRKELSLAALIRHYFQAGFEKQKKLQRSRWENRPLSEKQLRYAVQDTFYLIGLYVKLREELARAGLLDAAAAIFAEIAAVTWQEKTMNNLGHRHIHGYDSLSPAEQERLKCLYRWRFHKAKSSNRAVFMVCTDQELLRLAQASPPSSLDDLVACGLSRSKVQRYGSEFLDILNLTIAE